MWYVYSRHMGFLSSVKPPAQGLERAASFVLTGTLCVLSDMSAIGLEPTRYQQGVVGIAPPDHDGLVEERMLFAATQVSLNHCIKRMVNRSTILLRLNKGELLPRRQVADEV